MTDPWLNFQYTIEFSSTKNTGLCSVLSVSGKSVTHGSTSYIENSVRGGPVRKYVYGGTYTDPIEVSILLGEGARPWLEWFSNIQNGKRAEFRNVTLSLYAYGKTQQQAGTGQLWLRWDLINCFPVSWQIGAMGVEDSPTPMRIDMTLQFESMVILDGTNQMHEVMG
jgi:hypothetical protein